MAGFPLQETPQERPPYDPSVIPPAVRARVAAVEALYKSQPQSVPDGIVLPVAPQPSAAVSQAPVESAPSPPPPPAPAPTNSDTPPLSPAPASGDENSNTWKSKALSAQGRLEAAKKDLGELQEQYYREVMAQRRQPATPPPPPPQSPPQFLTQADVDNYGSDMLNVSQRAALQAIAQR